MNRRLLILAAVVLVVAVSGCVGGGGQSDGGNNGSMEGDNSTGDMDTSGGETEGETDSGGQTVSFGDAVTMSDEFAFEVQIEGEQVSTSGRFDGGNMYIRTETEQGTSEIYNVDGTQYIVTQGRCIRSPPSSMTPSQENAVVAEEIKSDTSEYSDVTASGTTTIDGTEAYVFEISANETGTTTYYVGVDSGNLLRIESGDSVTDLSSWGDVNPVEAPDANCQDMSQMPSGSMG